MSVARLLASKSLLVCVGPGGVGKTTVAAALGLQAARMGRRTLVLTIDPARRLAAMLGLDGLDDTVRSVPMALIDPTGAGGCAPLSAAMERLYDVLRTGDHDLVVLDTPPTRNALDILDAPGRLAGFLEEGVIKWFVHNPGEGLRGRLFARGGAAATKLLAMIAGDELVHELGEFFSVFMSLREGFQQRAQHVQQVLRAESSAFVLVSSAMAPNLADAQFLHDGLAAPDHHHRGPARGRPRRRARGAR